MQQDHPNDNTTHDRNDHVVRRIFMRPGEANDSPIWNNYIKLLVNPFVDHDDFRYSDEEEFQDLIHEEWQNAGVDDDVTIERERKLTKGTSAAQGSRIDFRVYHDDGHRVGVEVKGAGWWSADHIQEQLVRYAETDQIDSILLLTADHEHAEVDWPSDLDVPLFIVLLAGRRDLL